MPTREILEEVAEKMRHDPGVESVEVVSRR